MAIIEALDEVKHGAAGLAMGAGNASIEQLTLQSSKAAQAEHHPTPQHVHDQNFERRDGVGWNTFPRVVPLFGYCGGIAAKSRTISGQWHILCCMIAVASLPLPGRSHRQRKESVDATAATAPQGWWRPRISRTAPSSSCSSSIPVVCRSLKSTTRLMVPWPICRGPDWRRALRGSDLDGSHSQAVQLGESHS